MYFSYFSVQIMCIFNKKIKLAIWMIYIIFVQAYFTHTHILKEAVNYLLIWIFTSGVKDGVENAYFKKEMMILNTICDPTDKNWGDQIVYSHFYNVCMGKICVPKILYIIRVAILVFITNNIFLTKKRCFQHPFSLNSTLFTLLVLYKDQNKSVTLFIGVKYAFKDIYKLMSPSIDF